MAYGDYSGPDKPNKGHEGGACNRQRCQAEPALWWNHGSHSWYCADCKRDIGEDVVNKRNWELRHQPECGHPMFETREQMDARQQDVGVRQAMSRGPIVAYELRSAPKLDVRHFVPIDTRPAWVRANQAPRRIRR